MRWTRFLHVHRYVFRGADVRFSYDDSETLSFVQGLERRRHMQGRVGNATKVLSLHQRYHDCCQNYQLMQLLLIA